MLENFQGLHIEEDFPETRLTMAWRGPAPYRPWRWLATGVLIAALLGVINLAREAFQLWGANPVQQGDAAMLGFMAGISLILIYNVARSFGRLIGYWRELNWDAADAIFIAKRRGWLLWGYQTNAIPFAKFRTLNLELGPEGRTPLPVRLQLTMTDFDSFCVSLTSLGFEQRSETLEILSAIAHVVRAEGYRIHENTARKQSLQIWMRRVDYAGIDEMDADLASTVGDSDSVDFFPIPPRGVRPQLLEVTRPSYLDSVGSKTEFDLDRMRISLDFTQIDEWKPGEIVRILRPSAPWIVHVLLTGLATGAACALGYWFVFNTVQGIFGLESNSRLIVMGFTALTVGCVVEFLCWNNLQERELTIDWRQNCLTLRFGLNVRQWPLRDIQKLVLSTKEHTVSSSNNGKSTSRVDGYGARLELGLPLEDLVFIETERWVKTTAEAQEVLAPMGSQLARELQVNYARGPRGKTDADDLGQAFRFSGLQIAVLALIGMVAIGLLSVVAVRNYQISQQIAQLRDLGLDVVRMGQFGYNHQVVSERYVHIRLVDAKPLREHGEEINQLLRSLPKVGFDAEGSNLTNADLKHFQGVNVVLAKISKTAVSDPGIAILAESGELIFLEADETAVGDAGIAALRDQSKLRFLFVRQTRVSGEGYQQIRKINSLEVIKP